MKTLLALLVALAFAAAAEAQTRSREVICIPICDAYGKNCVTICHP